MSETKITDLVPQETIDKIKELNTEIQTLLTTYTQTAKELAKGIDVNVKVVGDIDRLEKLLVEKSREAATATERLNTVIAQQGQIVANTTNTISRQLMEQERVNKTQRASYTEYERVKQLLDQYHDTYEGQIQSLVKINAELAKNKKAQSDNEKALAMGRITMDKYTSTQAALIEQHRSLTQQKRTLTQIMTAEEKAAQAQEGSYVQLSQQLELLKKAYKELSAEGRESDFGKELESSIQNLDAHLKDVAADMGEFQRNVGNYAIAGHNGVVSTESLMAVLQQQAITTKDVSDQSKILLEARSMLDTSDANYAETITKINDKLAENRKKMSDVSDIMDTQATSVAEAEAQNKRLTEALKNVEQTSADANRTIVALNAKIEENNKVIAAGNAGKASIKKDLKELVLEIANLSIEYQNLSAEEKASAEGQELANHIQELTEQAGALKDAISDTNQAIANAASDTRGFDQLGGAIQLAIDGFGLATGAAEMLGISEGELTKIQTKLQAAIAASNAMTKIQNALQKQSAVMQGVSNLQTKAGTIAIKLKTAAEGKGVITTKLLTAAQWAFNKAAAANPIGLLVVAVTACILAVAGLIKIFNIFGSDSEKRKEQLKQEAETLDSLGKVYEQNTERLKAMGRSDAEVIASSIAGLKRLRDAWEAHYFSIIQLYDSDAEEYQQALDKKNEADSKFRDKLEEANNVMIRMFAEEGEQQIADEMERIGALHTYKVTKINQEMQKWKDLYKLVHTLDGTWTQVAQDTFDQRMDAIAQRRINKLNEEEEKEREESRKREQDEAKRRQQEAARAAEQLRKEVHAGEDALLNIITDSLERQRRAEILSYERRKSEIEAHLARTAETEITLRTALQNQLEGLTTEHNRKLADIEVQFSERRIKAEADLISSHLAIVKEGSDEELEWKLRQLSNQYDSELLAIQKAETAKTITAEQAEELRTNLVQKYALLREKAEEDHAAKVAELIQAQYATEQTEQNNAYISALNTLKNRYAQELAAAQGNAEKQAEIRAKFESEQARLGEEYAERTARASIKMLEEILKNEELSDADRLKYEQELAKAKVELETAMADAAVANIERVTNADNEARQKRLENAQAWLQKASEALSAINDLASAIYDGQLEKIESQQEANEAAGEAEQERITKLVEQNVITEEEGEARKRAAEDRTAKKTEELERKKAQIKYKQAIYDKALSVANVGLNTAMALMQLWVKPGWPAAIPMMAVVGAIGALQLATVLATPIPKYARGTDYHRGGPAIVGDGGRPEVVVYNDTMWLTPDKPTLVNLPVGTTVYPSIAEYDNNVSGLISVEPYSVERPSVVVNNDNRKLEEKMDRVIYLFSALNRSKSDGDVNSYLEIIKINKGL